MSNGTSSIMFSSSSSSSSSSSATKIGDLIEKMGQTPIHSCIIGISQLKFHSLSNNISHAALLLTTENRTPILKKKCESSEGILIEYGNYPPDESKAKKEEEDNIKNNLVIYRYGDKGGLRYYTNTIGFFRKKFCDVGCAVLQIPQFNQNTFSVLIELLAPKNDMKWIKENYNAIKFINKSHNCQDFVCHSIDILKPTYDVGSITNNNEGIFPDSIIKTLSQYEKDDE